MKAEVRQKFCKKCNSNKSIDLFVKNPECKDGYAHRCKDCLKKYNATYRNSNKLRIKKQVAKFYTENKERIIKRVQLYRSKNQSKIRILKHKHYQLNKAEIIKQTGERHLGRLKTDSLYKLKATLRHRTYLALRRKQWSKTNKFHKYIGCGLVQLKEHIERQFQPGMNWTNNTHTGWHIDHIIPLSSAKTEEELYRLFHYSNLQPLWASENLSKGNR